MHLCVPARLLVVPCPPWQSAYLDVGTTGLFRPPLPPAARLSRAGAQMRRIRTSKPGVVWLQAPGPCDLWTLNDEDGAPKEQELSFFNRTVVLKDGQLYTGLAHEGVAASVYGRTALLDFDRQLDIMTLEGAQALLSDVREAVRTPGVEHLLAAIAKHLD